MKLARICWTLLAVAAATGAVLVSAWPHVEVADASSAVFAAPESQFVGAINNQRAQAGLQPLQMDAGLTASAASWTSYMVAGSFIGHADPQQIQASVPGGGDKVGENVGRGRTVDSLVTAFMQSPAHRNNILDPAFTHIGVGVEVHPSSGTVYTTHRFASVAASPQPAPAQPTPSAPVLPDPLPQPVPATPTPTPATPTAPPQQFVPSAASELRGSRRADGPATLPAATATSAVPPSFVRGSRVVEYTESVVLPWIDASTADGSRGLQVCGEGSWVLTLRLVLVESIAVIDCV